MLEINWNIEAPQLDEIYFQTRDLFFNKWKQSYELGSQESNEFYGALEKLKQYLNSLVNLPDTGGVYA